MSDQQAKVDIVANAGQAKAEVDSFAARVAAASATVKSSFSGIASSVSAMHGQVAGDLGKVEGAIGAVTKRFAAWAALLAGGAVLKESVQATSGFTKEANSLAKALGINTTEASALNVALGDIYSNSDAMTSAASKLAKQLRTNEDALVGMGIKTRDANGNFRNMNELLMDSFKVVRTYAEGTDRTMAMQTAFGKGAEELGGLLKLNNQVLEDARIKQQELGLVVGVENVEANKRYRAAMNDVGDVMLAVQKAIGDAVMPVFTKLAEWFSAVGPTAVLVIKGSIGGLVSVFWGLKNAVAIVWEILDSFVYSIAEPLRTLAEGLYKVVTGDFKGAADVMMSWPDRIGQRWDAAWKSMVESSEETRDRIVQLFAAPTPTAPKDEQGKKFRATPEGDQRMQGWEAELDRQKVAHERMQAEQGTFYQFGKEREAAYWQEILGTLSAADKQRFAVQKKYYALVLDLRKEDFAAEQAELLTRIDAAKGNFVEQELLAELYADRMRQRYGSDSKEYQDALKRMQGIYRAHHESLREIDNIRRQVSREDQLEDIAAMERASELERELGTITQMQLLQIQRQALEMRRQIEEQAKQGEIDAMKGNPNADPVALEKLEAELLAIRRKYRGLKSENDGKQTVEQAKPFESIFGASQQAIEQGLNSMVANMKVTLGGLRSVAQQIGSIMLTELVTKPIAGWLVGQARMVLMTWVFGKQRVAAEAVVAAESTAIQGAASLKTIGMKAYEAAAGAYAAIAGIPYVGPVLAPVAAGVALAGVIAFAKHIFSAEQGFDIPAGMNPMVQTHAREMILPAKHADTIRMLGDMAASGQSIGGGELAVTLNATRLPGGYSIISDDELVAAFKRARRNFKL